MKERIGEGRKENEERRVQGSERKKKGREDFEFRLPFWLVLAFVSIREAFGT